MSTSVRLGQLGRGGGLSTFFIVILEDPLKLAVYRLQPLLYLLQHLLRRPATLSAASPTSQRAENLELNI